MYYPHQWMDRHHEDKAYLNEVLRFAVEISESEVQAGDLVLYRMALSYTHGAVIVSWPTRLIHAVRSQIVTAVDATRDRYMKNTPHRFFSFVKKASTGA
jgi:hypothetical protein